MYIKNGVYPISEAQIRAENPNTSFPQVMLPEHAALFGYDTFVESLPPAYDPVTQQVTEAAPIDVGGVWTQQWLVSSLDAATIAANMTNAKASKWAEIKASRDQRKDGGVLVNGKWFHTDTGSRIQQLGLVLMGAAVPAVAWKTMDGTFTTMSQTLAGQIFQAVAELDMALFSAAETHRTAMEASATHATYDFSTGWPEHYQI